MNQEVLDLELLVHTSAMTLDQTLGLYEEQTLLNYIQRLVIHFGLKIQN